MLFSPAKKVANADYYNVRLLDNDDFVVQQRFSRCFKRHRHIRFGKRASFEFEFQSDSIQPREGWGQLMPGHRAQDGIMRSAGEGDGELLALQADRGLALEEEPVDLGGVTGFKPPQFAGQEAIEGVGDHGHDPIKVHLDQNRGGHGLDSITLRSQRKG